MPRYLPFRPAIALLWLLGGCRQLADAPPDALGYDYFPLEVGSFTVYDVTDVTYSLSAPVVTRRYQLREVVREQFADQLGQPTFRLERAVRAGTGQPWLLDSVWTARRTERQAIRTENNRPLVKLIFPVRNNVQWNPNAFNNVDSTQMPFRMTRVGRPYAVGNVPFAETVTVIERLDSSLVDKNRLLSVYARGVGLVYRERQLLDCQTSLACNQTADVTDVNFGTKRFQRLISYGKE